MVEQDGNIQCGICGLKNDIKYTIQCEECKEWIHYNCTGLPLYQLLCLARTNRKFSCEKCCFEKYADPEWSTSASEAIERQRLTVSTQVTISQETPAETETQLNLSDGGITPYQHQQSADESQIGALGSSPEDMNLNLDLTPSSPSHATLGSNGPAQQNPTQPNQTPDSATNDQRREKAVCRYYKKGTCKYGIVGRDCKFSHPKACRRFMEHGIKNKRGCKLGTQCRWFHPTLCKSSLANYECLVDSCKQLHVKGTRRQRAPGTQHTTTPIDTPTSTDRVTTTLHSRPSAPEPGSEVSQDVNFLDLMKGVKSAIDVLAKAVTSQEILLANLAKGNKPNWVNLPQPQPGQNNQVPWLTALTSL